MATVYFEQLVSCILISAFNGKCMSLDNATTFETQCDEYWGTREREKKKHLNKVYNIFKKELKTSSYCCCCFK